MGNLPPKRLLGSETVVNPERRGVSQPAGVDGQHSDSSLLKVLFPSEVTSGDDLPLLEVDEIRIGHYQIAERIGSGGMGAVFRAVDSRLQRTVALKILAPVFARDHSAVQRFQNEARATALLDHDNIAGVFFIGESQGMHYIAYEYVQGKNIRDLIREQRRIPPSEAINYTLQIATALRHMSAAGVTHRDIKPSNIIITPKGRAKLVDLGLARKQSEDSLADLTVAGTTLGTFDYISPEQAKDPRNVDVRSDIYSLGCTLYHMLTGEPPYPEGTVLQKLLDHQGGEPPDPAARNRRVSAALSAVVRRMMASDPRKRYSSPDQLIRDLMQVAGSLGMRGTTTEGLVWTATGPQRPSFWIRNLGWMSTAATLLLIVVLMQRFPQIGRQSAEDLAAPEVAGTFQDGADEDQPTGLLTSRELGGSSVSGGGLIAVMSGPDHPRSPEQPTLLAPDPPPVAEPGGVQGVGQIFERISPLIIPGRLPEDRRGGALGPLVGGASEDPATASIGSAINSIDQTNSGEAEALPGPAGPLSIGAPPIVLYSSEGETEQTFLTLEAACAAAADGSVIELRYHGKPPSGRGEKPLQITDKKVTIRARDGMRPEIRFRTSLTEDVGDARMIRLNGGAIELVNVDLVMTVDDLPSSDRCALFSLEAARQVLLSGVTIRLRNETSFPVALFELGGTAPGSPMGLGGEPNQRQALELSMTDSVVAAAGDLFVIARPLTARISVTNSALALFGCVCRQSEGTEMVSASASTELRIERSTCVTAGLIDCRSDQLLANLVPITVSCNDSVLSSIDGVSELVTLVGEGSDEELLRMVPAWSGSGNVYDGIPGFLTLRSELETNELLSMNFSQWEAYWSEVDGATVSNSVEIAVPWQVPWTGRSVDEWTTAAFGIDPIPATDAEPAAGSRLPGADLRRLPQLSPYAVTPVVQ